MGNLLEGLFARAGTVLQAAEAGRPDPQVDPLRFQTLPLDRRAPAAIGHLIDQLSQVAQAFDATALRGQRLAAGAGGGGGLGVAAAAAHRMRCRLTLAHP